MCILEILPFSMPAVGVNLVMCSIGWIKRAVMLSFHGVKQRHLEHLKQDVAEVYLKLDLGPFH